MHKTKKRTYRIWIFCAILLGIGALMLHFFNHGETRVPGTYSTEWVEAAEAASELGFGTYDEVDWTAWFAQEKDTYLNRDTVRRLLEQLELQDYISLPDGRKNTIDRVSWNEIYEQILDYVDMESVVAKTTVLILSTDAGGEQGTVVTNQGTYQTNLPLAYFETWQAYTVYGTGEKILGIAEKSEEKATISNAYLTDISDGNVSFLYDGTTYQREIGTASEAVGAGVCDLVFENGEIVSLRVKQETIAGELLSYDDETIEIEGYGKVKHTGKIPVYQTYGEVAQKELSDVILGNMEAKYITGDGEVCAILICQPAEIETIRVLLLSDGSNFREKVYLKCDGALKVSCGERKENVPAKTLIGAADYIESESENQTLLLSPESEDAYIYICDETGTPVSNGYPGTMEVRRYEEGYTLVNALPLETYLTAVVPSEMPSSYQIEALKAQAVCARSYAYIQLFRAELAKYGAHIDDSTAYQVYNKNAPTAESKRAVEETAGQVLTYQGNIVEAYYFSTSMGYTDTAEIWNVEDLSSYGYLKSACLNSSTFDGDLSKEDDFLSYISGSANGYDSDIKYYRWFATADFSDRTDTINDILATRKVIAPSNIVYLKKDGQTELTTTAKMGTLTAMTVEERSGSGAILTLKLTYEKGIVLVKSEYNVRKVLGACVQKIVYADGSTQEEVSLLPSAFAAIVTNEDGTLLLHGGGYGHGLGMSQNGANGMAKSGMGYEDILHYFYNDVNIESMSDTAEE